MQQQMVLPEGGLASFLTSNLDEMDDSRLAFGSQNGINSMRETAERMAKMGRGGDDVIIHAKTRERLIPQEVSDGNPELMSQVDIAIANAGADPSAYIIGSETNSVNPYTGQREFFLKKLISGVKNVFKKLAPIIVPIALNFIAPGLGSIASGFIGSGITALAQGKNFKESLKAGLIGGVLGGISSGMKGVMAKGEGVKGNMFERFGQGFEQGALPDLSDGASSMFKLGKAEGSTLFGKPYDVEAGNKAIAGGNTPVMDKLSGTFYNDPVAAVGPDVQGAVNTLNATGKPFEMADAITLANQSVTAAVPGSIKYIPTIAAGSALAYGLGAFDEIEPEKVDDPYDSASASERRLANFPRRYSTDTPIAGMGANMDDVMVPYYGEQMAQPTVQVAQSLEEQYPDLYKQYLAENQTQFAAAGGPMESFPRRTGYIAGPGTETSDDIPAMLSDGEFVMNAKAVRGAGNGSREQGVRNMYQMMRAFEGGAVA